MTTYATNFEGAQNAPVVHPFDYPKFAATPLEVMNVSQGTKILPKLPVLDEDETTISLSQMTPDWYRSPCASAGKLRSGAPSRLA